MRLLLTCYLLLFACFILCSQNQKLLNNPDSIGRELSDYVVNNLQEKSYLITDRPYYALGDTIWFNAFLVNALNHQPMTYSNTLYVDLLNSNGEVLLSRVLLSREGIAPGDFPISEKWEPGRYQLRAYTRWMQNLPEEYLFYKTIDIYDIWPGSEQEDAPHKMGRLGLPKKMESQISKVQVRLFPEGGNLIRGFPTLMGVKVTFAGTEKGLAVKGSVLSERTNKVICSFESNEFGLGAFVFTNPTERYKIVLDSPAFEVEYRVAPIETGTYGMKVVNRLNASNVHVIVETDISNGLEGGVLIGHTRGEVFCNLALKEVGALPRKMISVPSKIIPSGVVHFTFFDPQGFPQAERLIFVDHGDRLVGADIEANNPNMEFDKRDKVELSFDLGDSLQGFVTVRVNNAEVVTEDPLAENLYTYLMLGSDIGGRVETPAYYLTEPDRNKYQMLDYIMLTHGWRRFTWDEVMAGGRHQYQAEAGLTFSGQLKNFTVRSKYEEGFVQLTSMKQGAETFADGFNFNTTRTDPLGHFTFNELYYADTVKLIFQAKKSEETVGNRYFIDLAQHEAPQGRKVADTLSFSNEEMQTFIEKSNKQYMIEKSFGKDVTVLEAVAVEAKGENPVQDAVAGRYASPDYRLMADSLKGQNFYLIDILRQIPFVQFDGQGTIKIRNVVPTVYLDGYELEPAVVNNIIQGTPGHDIYFVDADRSGFSDSRGNPILYVYTKSGNGVEMPNDDRETPGVLQITHPGYNRAREFYRPEYGPAMEPVAKPDYRLLLFWDPAVRIQNGKGEVSFYVGDDRATYDVLVEGLSKDGEVIMEHKKLHVK